MVFGEAKGFLRLLNRRKTQWKRFKDYATPGCENRPALKDWPMWPSGVR